MQIDAGTFRRRRISMTSLIDVIFLLLLFFMLSSTFSRFSDVELNTGGGGQGSQAAIPAFVKLSGSGLSLNGETAQLDGLAQMIRRLQERSDINAIILSVDESASAQQFVDVLVVARQLTGINLQVVK